MFEFHGYQISVFFVPRMLWHFRDFCTGHLWNFENYHNYVSNINNIYNNYASTINKFPVFVSFRHVYCLSTISVLNIDTSDHLFQIVVGFLLQVLFAHMYLTDYMFFVLILELSHLLFALSNQTIDLLWYQLMKPAKNFASENEKTGL